MNNSFVIEVKVNPNASVNKVEKLEERRYKVYVKAPAVDGKANKLLIEILSEFFNIRKHQVEFLRGETSRQKLIKITL